MCALEKMISCELSFTPLGSTDYEADVDKVIRVIEASALTYTVGAFATVVQGSKKEVFKLIEAVYDEIEDDGSFVLGVKLSNACGCGVK